jgi:hypothetical protein
VARIDPLLTRVGSWTLGKAVTPERLNTVLTRTYAGHVSANNGTTSRCGVCRFRQGRLLALVRPNIPSPGTERRVTKDAPYYSLRTDRPIRSCVRCLGAWRPYVRNPVAHGTRCPWPVQWVERRKDEGAELRDSRQRVAAGGAVEVAHPRSPVICRLPRPTKPPTMEAETSSGCQSMASTNRRRPAQSWRSRPSRRWS